ncbi:hypothetical protein CF336_g7723, partial [Tilletia laevis]
CSTSVITADGGRLRATGKGVVFLPIDDDQARLLPLSEVLLVPGLDFNLVSVYQLNQEQLRVEFTEELEAEITDPFYHGWKVTARWSKESQAYLVPVVRDKEHAFTASMMEYDDESDDGSDEASDDEEVATPVSDNERLRLGEMWHERLGHIGKSMLPTLAKNSVGLPELFAKRKNCGVSSCETCSLTNIKRSPFPDSTTKTTRPLELVHADLTGRIITKSLGGAEYLAVLVDDHTRMVWVLPLARKSDFADKFIEWRDEVVPHKGPIGTLRTDGGGEFNNWAIKAALSGARHEKSCAYTAQQNGVAERHVGIIKTIMRPLLHARNLPLVYWAEAASTAAYLRNHRPSRPLGGKTPFELWYGTPPRIDHLRIFGCLAFVMLPDKAREHSLSARARVGVFIGYDKYSKGYRVHFPDTGALAISRNVDFHEDKGYNFNTLVPEPTTITTPDVVVQSASRPPGTRPRLVVIGPRPPPAPPSPKIVEIELSGPAAPAPAPGPAPAPAAVPLPAAAAAPEGAVQSPAPTSAPAAAGPSSSAPRRRARAPPTIQYQTRQHQQRLLQGREQRATAGTVLSLSDSFATAFKAQLSADGIELEPNTLKDAMRRPDWAKWLEAMREEIDSHMEMGTWELAELPEGRDVVGSRWVFKLKLDSAGNVARYKGRLVAQGFSQIPGVDYDETYSPVTRFISIRTLLALAAYFHWHVHQLDVVTAYLYGLLDRPIYMRQPALFEAQGAEHLVCQLRRAIYGLKQSGREWYYTLHAALIDMGFVRCLFDPAIFIFGTGEEATVVAVYVDDVLVFGRRLEDINSFKSSFAKRFKMKDQGEIGQFLGINIERSPDGTSFLISQAAYIKSMLARFGFEHLKPAPSPLDSKQRLVPYEGQASEADTKLFQSMVGCLMWLSQASRADLAYAVAALARHAKNPGPIHLGCAKRVMRYVAGTIDFKLRIASHSEEDIVAHSDADLGGDHSAKSTSGWCISVHGATVAWGSKLQTLVADSTAQAELIAVWQTAREVLAIQHLLEDLGLRSTDAGPPSVIYCDNQPAIHNITNPVSNGLSRHIERKYLSTREHQERGLVKVQYINTRVNPADVFTKPLAPATFIQHRGTLGINNHHQSTST